MSKLYTQREAAELAGISYFTLSRYISQDLIQPHVRKTPHIHHMAYRPTNYFTPSQISHIRSIRNRHILNARMHGRGKTLYTSGREITPSKQIPYLDESESFA